MSLTNYARTALTNHLLGKSSFTKPTTVYAALFTADPTLAGTLTNEVPSGVGYARQAITSTMSASSGGGSSANAADIVFGHDATTDWGNITHVGLMDSATIGAGNMLEVQAAARLIQIGDDYLFRSGDLVQDFTSGCSLSNYARTALINHLLGKTAFTMPTNVYAALFKADPTKAGTLTNEVASGVGYARQAATATMSSSSGGGASANASDILFGPDTTTDWGTISHLALIDGATLGAGNMLTSLAAPVAKLVQVKDGYVARAGALTLTFT